MAIRPQLFLIENQSDICLVGAVGSSHGLVWYAQGYISFQVFFHVRLIAVFSLRLW